MLTLQGNRFLAVGEAMIEMAVIGEDTYRRSFAGDTFNTLWHVSQIPDSPVEAGFVTRIGTDSVSDNFLQMLSADGIDTTAVSRDLDRIMGLYMIELDGAERSFAYWRDASAARLLAEDEDWLNSVMQGASLVHVSGITLGILSPDARDRLRSALVRARSHGARISFDPNYRPRLWRSSDEARDAMKTFTAISDIALPSFDDEAGLWGDETPRQTLERFDALGVQEVVVKNGAEGVHLSADGRSVLPTPAAIEVRDTTGAGDAFNAGYLAARLAGVVPEGAVAGGQTMAREVIRHYGARIPKSSVPSIAG